MSTLNFFRHLQSFNEKEFLFQDQNYSELPEDWTVFITDVKGSTVAIEKGLYKEVNIAGVTSIVCVKNALNDFDFPFVFGGDGATLLVPQVHEDKVKISLAFCRNHIKKNFDLELRVGHMPYKKLKIQGSKIEVAKMKLSEGNEIAMLRGSGLSEAEKLIKSDEKNLIEPAFVAEGNNQGLECRWNPIPSSKGNFLSLIIKSRSPSDTQSLSEVLQFILYITDDERFLTFRKLPKTWPPKYLKQEMVAKYGKGLKAKLATLFVYILTKLFSLIVAKVKETDQSAAAKYMNQLVQNTDFVKVDESLKLVIDTSEAASQEILKKLESKYQSGLVFYGAHVSKEAMMTCFVRSMTNHIHFIDGGSGGYAMAAKQLKQQMAQHT